MAESKFSGIFDAAATSKPTPVERQENPAPGRSEKRQVTRDRQPSRQAGPGRPPGKSSDPEWEQTTVQLKRATKQAARTILITRDGRQDLSEVLQQLLEQWVKKEQKL
jgi:hypothetical protein